MLLVLNYGHLSRRGSALGHISLVLPAIWGGGGGQPGLAGCKGTDQHPRCFLELQVKWKGDLWFAEKLRLSVGSVRLPVGLCYVLMNSGPIVAIMGGWWPWRGA